MLQDVLAVLRAHDHFLITTHVRPDGDAIGSQLALGLFLESLGKQVMMLNNDELHAGLDWMPGSEKIEKFEGTIAQCRALSEVEALVVVDANSYSRLGKRLAPALRSCRVESVLIDHHPGGEDWFTARYVDVDAAATGVLIYHLLCMYDPATITPQIATALYTAIMTDTGSFRFSTTNPDVLRMGADLLERSHMRADEIYGHVYETRSPSWPRLVSRALSTLTFDLDGTLAYMVLPQGMLKETFASRGDTEGMSDFAMSVTGVEVTLVFTETSRGVKVGLRSKGTYPVHDWARSLGGGGHPTASGAYVHAPLPEVIDRVLAEAPRYMGYSDDLADVALTEEDEAYLATLSSLDT